MPRATRNHTVPDPKTVPLRSTPQVPEMQRRESRKDTFVDWDEGSPVRPKELARAGLYWPKEHRDSDRVRCHHCGVEIDAWESGDDPLDQHLRFTRSSYAGSGCEFALRRKAHRAWTSMGAEQYGAYLHRKTKTKRTRPEVSRGFPPSSLQAKIAKREAEREERKKREDTVPLINEDVEGEIDVDISEDPESQVSEKPDSGDTAPYEAATGLLGLALSIPAQLEPAR